MGYCNCRWCGCRYDFKSSTANNKVRYCSRRCEIEAQRSEMESRRLQQDSGRSGSSSSSSSSSGGGSGGSGAGCSPAMIKWGAIVFIVLVLIAMCSDDNEEEKQNDKTTPRTEQVTKTSKRETQAVRKPVKKMELVAENVPTEETPQVVSEEVPVAPSANEEQATARQASEEQVSETSIEEQVENELEAVEEETLENTPAEETLENALVEESVFDAVEQMPEFPGGRDQLNKYYESNLRYPEVAIENGIQGCVIVQFIVNTDGSISDATVIRSVDPACDEEALRFINSMPHWTPGQTNGKNVRVRYTLPVAFRLI